MKLGQSLTALLFVVALTSNSYAIRVYMTLHEAGTVPDFDFGDPANPFPPFPPPSDKRMVWAAVPMSR